MKLYRKVFIILLTLIFDVTITSAAFSYVHSTSDSRLLFNNIKEIRDSRQIILVTTDGFSKDNASVAAFEQIGKEWHKTASFAADVGINGFAYNKVEGDGHSPIGIFSIGIAFGRYTNPGTSMKYRQSTSNDFWVNDISSPFYNTWQVGTVRKIWKSAEKMYISQYNYGFVINYNTSKRIPGKGSAIFFHVWRGPGRGTTGCTAASQNNVIKILRWLKPSKNPVIIEGPLSEVLKMK